MTEIEKEAAKRYGPGAHRQIFIQGAEFALSQEQDLLKLARENNYMLRQIVCFMNQQIKNEDSKSFGINVLANILSNKITGE